MVQQKILRFESEESEMYFVNIGIPIALIFLSLSCQVGFTSIVQCAYQDARIFPFEKKGTATNIIILVSKFFTIGVSFVNEMNEPIPILIVLLLGLASVFMSFAFPSKEALDQMTVEHEAELEKQKRMLEAGVKLEQEKIQSKIFSIQ